MAEMYVARLDGSGRIDLTLEHEPEAIPRPERQIDYEITKMRWGGPGFPGRRVVQCEEVSIGDCSLVYSVKWLTDEQWVALETLIDEGLPVEVSLDNGATRWAALITKATPKPKTYAEDRTGVDLAMEILGTN